LQSDGARNAACGSSAGLRAPYRTRTLSRSEKESCNDHSTIAAQLYNAPRLHQTPADIATTLKRVRRIGYEAVQLSALGKIDPKELARSCKAKA